MRNFRTFHHLDSKASRRYGGGWEGGRRDEEVGSDSQVGPDFSLTPSQLAYRLQVTWFPMQKASRIDTGLPPSYFGTAAIIQLKL